MERKIKVNFLIRGESREVSVEEAAKILEQSLKDKEGGLIFDAQSKKVIYKIQPETREILVLEAFLGGG